MTPNSDENLVVYSTTAARSFLDSSTRFLRQRKTIRYGLASELKRKIEDGAFCDVALLTDAAMDDLIGQGKFLATSRVVAFKSGVGVAIRRGADVAPIRSAAELKQALISAKSVAISAHGAGGAITRQVFERLGIAEIMAAKTLVLSTGVSADAVVDGRAELGFSQISEICCTEGAQLHGPLPPELQAYSTFAAAIATHTKVVDAARAFVREFEAPAARREMKAKGLEPV